MNCIFANDDDDDDNNNNNDNNNNMPAMGGTCQIKGLYRKKKNTIKEKYIE
jgi:hypothetical protein